MEKKYESEYTPRNGKTIKITIIINNQPSDKALRKFGKQARQMLFNRQKEGK